MNLDQAKDLLNTQINNRNGVTMILLEVHKSHGQTAVDQLISEFDLEQKFGFKPGESLFG
ncbi:MAG: hypothetical protein OEZ33_06465 [Gammaproteobacteria bacterium]|nr:hypothetical protein [Gammaproteobacteria bacterium]MDH5777833.1 hypothetical protein [Gammaproteobacteria bacterium]